MKPAYIYDTVRTPRGRAHAEKGALKDIPPIALMSTVLDAIHGRNKLDTSWVEEIDLGCSTATGEQGANIAKIASLNAGWSERANGVTVSSFCTSGLEAVQMAAMKIMTGSISCAVAGGVESMSRVPMFSDNGPWFTDSEIRDNTHFIHMGLAADVVANLEHLSSEELNDYSIRSHRLAVRAWESIDYKKDVIPVMCNGKPVLVRDQGMRVNINSEKMSELDTLFNAVRHGTNINRIVEYVDELKKFECLHTVGNAPLIADGASLCLMGNRHLGTKLGKKPIAKLSQFATVSVDPVTMLTGVVDATKKLLKKSKLKLSDIDLFEVNESFAAVPLMFMRRLGITEERVNISGGAIALGHPLGATGGILLGTLIHNLRQSGRKRGVVTICGGAGIAQATLVEVM